jgi:hypothetical protein
LPDDLRGTTDRETMDKLWKRASGLREEMSRRGAVPEKPDGYKLELTDDARAVFGDPDKDAATKIFRTIAHKHGLTDRQASGLFSDFHSEMIAGDLVKPVNVMDEARKLLGPEASGLTSDQLRAKAGERWAGSVEWLNGLEASKVLSPNEALLAKAVLETADGITLFEKLKVAMREPGIKTGGGPAPQMTREQLDARNNDPRGNPRDPRYDANFEKETERLFREFYGTKAAA